MRKVLIVACLAALMISLAGCEDTKSNPLEFRNSSTYTVVVQSLSTEWSSFALAPGEKKKLTDIRDVDFTFEPSTRVQEGSASTERYIVFVNINADVTSW